MKEHSAFLNVAGLLLLSFLIAAPAGAQKPDKLGKPKPPDEEQETLMVAFRDGFGDRMTPPPDEDAVYVDGDPGISIVFGSSGNMLFELKVPRGKDKNKGRHLTLDFTDLAPYPYPDGEPGLAEGEVRPGFAYGELPVPSSSPADFLYFFVAPDDGQGNPHPDGIQGISPQHGFIPTRVPLFFTDGEGGGWRLTWPRPIYADRGTGFAALECVQADYLDPDRCVAWTVQFADIADYEWDNSVLLPLDRPVNTTGNAVLETSEGSGLDGHGVYIMPFKIAICLSPDLTVGECYALAQ